MAKMADNCEKLPNLDVLVIVKDEDGEFSESIEKQVAYVPRIGEAISFGESESVYKVCGIVYAYYHAKYDVEIYVEEANLIEYVKSL